MPRPDASRNWPTSCATTTSRRRTTTTCWARRWQSSLATSLNRQQQGDQFRIIDPPSLPEKSSFPDRFKFSLAGLGVGLGAGVRLRSRLGVRGRSNPQRTGPAGGRAIAGVGGDSAVADRQRNIGTALETLDRSGRSGLNSNHHPNGDLVRLLLGIGHVQTVLRAEQEPVRDQPGSIFLSCDAPA